MNTKGFVAVVMTAAVTSLSTLYLAARYQDSKIPILTTAPARDQSQFAYAGFGDGSRALVPQVDFQPAAEGSVSAVVHLKTSTKARSVSSDPQMDDFFGGLFGGRQFQMPPQQGSGSGVVISADGYIVTNNHVVAGADEVTVTFNNRTTLTAKVIGADPSTDIAVVKVDKKNLPFLEFGNSDDVKLGQWVLAIGYPLSLDATVTAGIVSAKSRSIGINARQSRGAIESFIQTDAAVNPGNSGGALVNTSGQLIGINSAIASATGYYAGISYAIPSNLVRKVANDLMQFGTFQRGYLGIQLLDTRNATPDQATALGLDSNPGVYVNGVSPTGGAKAAGIQKGDFITAINGVAVNTEPELLEHVAGFKPGDNVSLTYLRKGTTRTASVQLKNLNGNTDVVKSGGAGSAFGATLRPLNKDEQRSYGMDAGVVVENPGDDQLGRQTTIRKGFIITSIDDQKVTSVDDAQSALGAASGRVEIAGFYPGSKGTYYYSLRTDGSATDQGEGRE